MDKKGVGLRAEYGREVKKTAHLGRHLDQGINADLGKWVEAGGSEVQR